ncbi:hypothetical protein LTR62_007485 [Meristemomyces frigidus]|uniref:DUF7728 domain-containing protein n=1 Tax=Meristemomyces frigidus TaxID=1508187 RepID=A0AAN7TAW9_9PEZI|nr:hypothetical protein LTR62_007485 [Meristemomyces frigidus]
MLGRTIGVAATCALGASAFLIPPGLSAARNHQGHDLSLQQTNPRSRTLVQTCPACAFPMTRSRFEEGDTTEQVKQDFWIQGGSNSLVFNFSISEDGERLRLNGADVYSPRLLGHAPYDMEAPTVRQIPSDTSYAQIEAGREARSANLAVTGFRLAEMDTEILSPKGDMLLPVRFEIVELEGQLMEIGAIEVKMFKTNDGELMIMQIETNPRPHSLLDYLLPPPSANELAEELNTHGPPPPPFHHHPPGPPFDGEDMDFPPPPPGFHGPPHGPPHGPHHNKECDVLPAPLCRLKNVLDAKIDAALGPSRHRKGGCPGRKGQHGPPGFPQGHPPFGPPGLEERPPGPPRPHHGRPHHARPHGRHHGPPGGHFWGHGFLRTVAKGLVSVLIPIFAGITVGMSVSLLGLIVGRLITFSWVHLVRGGRRGGYGSVAREEILDQREEDRRLILAALEAPPLYEDAPVYKEKAPAYDDSKEEIRKDEK